MRDLALSDIEKKMLDAAGIPLPLPAKLAVIHWLSRAYDAGRESREEHEEEFPEAPRIR